MEPSPRAEVVDQPISCETHPDRYRHWTLSFDGAVATLGMDVREDAGLTDDYRLKLNSYDLGVDIELADAIQRIRFEHPEVRVVVIRSLKERIFCAGANIFMLAGVGPRLQGELLQVHQRDAARDGRRQRAFRHQVRLRGERRLRRRRLRAGARLRRDPAGRRWERGGEPAGNAAARRAARHRRPDAPVDKRKVRRDLADVFCTLVEGVKGKRAVQWGLVDAVYPTSRFEEARRRARDGTLAAPSDRPRR